MMNDHRTPFKRRPPRKAAERRGGFTLVESLVVAAILAVVVAMAFMLTSWSRRTERTICGGHVLQGVHMGMVMYAQGNKHKYPGLNADGSDADLSVEGRLHVLLTSNYFTGEYLVGPAETKTPWTTGPLTSDHYAYALLQVPEGGGRRQEWGETMNARGALAGDRNVGPVSDPKSLWGRGGEPWRGDVLFNDGRVERGVSHFVETQYGSRQPNSDDHLFEAAGTDDALLVHSGN